MSAYCEDADLPVCYNLGMLSSNNSGIEARLVNYTYYDELLPLSRRTHTIKSWCVRALWPVKEFVDRRSLIMGTAIGWKSTQFRY